MRGRLATTAKVIPRSPPLPEGERLATAKAPKPFPLWGKLKEGTRPKGASEGRGEWRPLTGAKPSPRLAAPPFRCLTSL